MKKLIIVLGILLLLCLTGCNNPETENNKTKEEQNNDITLIKIKEGNTTKEISVSPESLLLGIIAFGK